MSIEETNLFQLPSTNAPESVPVSPQELEKAITSFEKERIELLNNNKEYQAMMHQLVGLIKKFAERLEKNDALFVEHTTSLKEQISLFDKISANVRTTIKSIDPEEGREVVRKYNERIGEFTETVQSLQTALDRAKTQAIASIRAMAAEVSNHTKARYAKIASYIAAMIVLTTCISGGMCYFMMKKFPAYIRITGASEISITGGDVRILESPISNGSTIKTPNQK